MKIHETVHISHATGGIIIAILKLLFEKLTLEADTLSPSFSLSHQVSQHVVQGSFALEALGRLV